MDISGLRKISRRQVIVYASFAFLMLATIYAAWYANYYLSANSDDIIPPYFFMHFHFHDIILPGQHSNILKFPLFILQAVIPYTFKTFSIVNIGLVLCTIIGWAILLIWLLGKRYAAIICLALTSILLGSQLFVGDLIGTTIRNIEYPIILGFVAYAGLLFQKQNLTRAKLWLGGILGVLYAAVVAGDSFFFYTIFISLVAVLAVFWFFAEPAAQRQRRYGLVLAYLVGATVLGAIIRELVKFLGIAHYFTAAVFLPHILPLSHIGPSITTATTQVVDLFGADIFGQNVALTNSLVFLNFFLLILGLVGLVYILRDCLRITNHKSLLKRLDFAKLFTLAVMAMAFFVIFAAYIASDLVVQQNSNGTITSLNQERYLTMLPLVLVIGIAYLLWRSFNPKKSVMVGLPLLIIALLLVNAMNIKHSHVENGTLRTGPITVAQTAVADHIQLLVTGYWYGASTRFWSGDKVTFATVADCNIPQPSFNNRLSWYQPSPVVHSSALVVVHQGPDGPYWRCTDQQLQKIYGTPVKIIHINANDHPELWIYNYDLRNKLLPLNY